MDVPGGIELLVLVGLFWVVPILLTLFVLYWVVRIAVRHELRINPPRVQPTTTLNPQPRSQPDWRRDL